MIGTSLQTDIRKALAANEEMKLAATPDEFLTKVEPVRSAAKAVSRSLLELQSVPVLLAKYFISLSEANDGVIAALKSVGQSYSEQEVTALKGAMNAFQAAATQFTEKEAALAGAFHAEPLLSQTGRLVVSIAAASMLVVGTVFGALGTGMRWAAGTTVSYWCAFTACALATVWIFAYFTVRRPLPVAIGTTRAGSSQQYLVFGGMAFLVLGLLFFGILQGTLLQFLTSISGARGLITFLIAIGTIAIAVILTLAAVIMDAGANPDELKERLSKGKEILTVLVGVLGTIVGFYFASNTDGSDGKITVGIIEAAESVEAGNSFVVLAMTTGGQMPYAANALVSVDKGVTVVSTVSAQGLIRATFSVPPGVTGPVTYSVGLTDKAGKTAATSSIIEVVAPKVAPPKNVPPKVAPPVNPPPNQ